MTWGKVQKICIQITSESILAKPRYRTRQQSLQQIWSASYWLLGTGKPIRKQGGVSASCQLYHLTCSCRSRDAVWYCYSEQQKTSSSNREADETKAAHTQQQQGVVCLYCCFASNRRLTEAEERGGQ